MCTMQIESLSLLPINNQEMGYSNVPLLHRGKSEDIVKTIHGYKKLRLQLNMSELAKISGSSRRSLYNHQADIEDYWSDVPIDDALYKDIDFIIQRSFALYFKSKTYTIEDLIGVVLGIHLRYATDILDKCTSLKSLWETGKHIVMVYKSSCRYKDESGSPVSSQNKFAHYLTNNMRDTLHKIFTRSQDYKVGERSKRWKATTLLDEYIRISVNKFLVLMSEYAGLGYIDTPCHMLPKKCANQNHIYTISIYIDMLCTFEIKSIFIILLSTVRITMDSMDVLIVHDASTDESLGRSYNVFSRIRSNERLQLGYISYDMSSALQSISLQLIKAAREDFQLLFDYTTDKEHKKRMRCEIADTLRIDTDKVKSKLTSFANGSISGINLHPYYRGFQEESDRLRRAVLKHVSLTEPKVLERAIQQSTRELPEELDWMDTESEETHSDMRNKASVFFFVWTWYERLIRQAMLTVLTDGIEVHDAVYSKMDIPPAVIEQVIRDVTGFDIIIEKEMPDALQ